MVYTYFLKQRGEGIAETVLILVVMDGVHIHFVPQAQETPVVVLILVVMDGVHILAFFAIAAMAAMS